VRSDATRSARTSLARTLGPGSSFARTLSRPLISRVTFARSPLAGSDPARPSLGPSLVPFRTPRFRSLARAFSDPSFHWLAPLAPSYPSREPPEGPIARGFQRTRLLRTPRSLCSLARAFSDPSTVFSPTILGERALGQARPLRPPPGCTLRHGL
jgi:hypothetical protein